MPIDPPSPSLRDHGALYFDEDARECRGWLNVGGRVHEVTGSLGHRAGRLIVKLERVAAEKKPAGGAGQEAENADRLPEESP